MQSDRHSGESRNPVTEIVNRRSEFFHTATSGLRLSPE